MHISLDNLIVFLCASKVEDDRWDKELPKDLFEFFLSYLAFPDICSCAGVSRVWRATILAKEIGNRFLARAGLKPKEGETWLRTYWVWLKTTFDLDVEKGFNPISSHQSKRPFGYITKLVIDDMSIKPSVEISDILNPECTYLVVGVLSRLNLSKSNLRKIIFKVKVLVEIIYPILARLNATRKCYPNSVKIEFEVFSFDSIKNKYFKCIHTEELNGDFFIPEMFPIKSKMYLPAMKKFHTLSFSFFAQNEEDKEINFAKNCDEKFIVGYPSLTFVNFVQNLWYFAKG